MFDSRVDLGQILLMTAVTIIGYFIKNEISTLTKRLDKHDGLILNLVRDVQLLIGMTSGGRRAFSIKRNNSDE